VIQAAGGSAYVYGISSGACLALEAAIQLGDKIKKLAIYEAPYDSEPAARQEWRNYRRQLKELVSSNQRGEAVVLFMRMVHTPEDMINGMQHSPMMPLFEAEAPTLEYDAAYMGEDRAVPVDRAAMVRVPTLVMDGGGNLTVLPFMHASATALAQSIPHAQQRTLEGQTHAVAAEALAPVLVEYFLK
jgi:pimeloyl-ACP methyl ester carboxylesterase